MQRLTPTLKDYSWGLPVHESLAAKFGDAQKLHTCAEAWWGSHPSGPAYCLADGRPLEDIPYLLKVISVGKALSIQVHPDKANAARLHTLAPEVYPDPNPKPEVAIAITAFRALCGFLPPEKIRLNLEGIVPDPDGATFEQVLSMDLPDLLHVVDLACRKHPLVNDLAKQYPQDPGVLAPLFMNEVSLQPGEALVIPSMEAHCYLSGQAVEAMTPSDNVVRAGLTNKMCDLPLFFSLAKPGHREPIILRPPENACETFIYKHHCLNLCLRRIKETSKLMEHGILLIIQGDATLTSSTDLSHTTTGDSWLISTESTIHSDGPEGPEGPKVELLAYQVLPRP